MKSNSYNYYYCCWRKSRKYVQRFTKKTLNFFSLFLRWCKNDKNILFKINEIIKIIYCYWFRWMEMLKFSQFFNAFNYERTVCVWNMACSCANTSWGERYRYAKTTCTTTILNFKWFFRILSSCRCRCYGATVLVYPVTIVAKMVGSWLPDTRNRRVKILAICTMI